MKDHPRIRGENGFSAILAKQAFGSPPHTRGKYYFVCLALVLIWITPAYAGKIRLVIVRAAGSPDHPRIRGENCQGFHERQPALGSPPHTRGKLEISVKDFQRVGITPAYAGKMPGQTAPLRRCRDHPRIRGENQNTVVAKNFAVGSPPHTRGKSQKRRGRA